MIENIIKVYGLYLLIAVIVETVIIIALLLWHYFSSHKYADIIDGLEREKKKLRKQLALANENLKGYVKALEQANANFKQIYGWYEDAKRLLAEHQQQSNVTAFDLSAGNRQQVNTTRFQYQYLQEANGGKFMRLLSSPEKCYFRTWENGGVRKYEFFGNVAKALANINAIFDDVCEIEGKRSGATDIENISAGTLDSELRVTSKAKIRLK